MTARRPRRTAASDYRDRTLRELSVVSKSLERSGHPAPMGDPLSGVMMVVEQPVGPRLLDALSSSLRAVDIPDAYVTWTETDSLRSELLMADPSLLVVLGDGAASSVDSLDLPLVTAPFSDATRARPFPWKKTTVGLLLPSLAPALDDEDEKRRFWRAFLTLKTLVGPKP